MINIQIQIFLTIAVGYLITKLGLISKSTRSQLTNLVLYVILPCNIFMSFNVEMTAEILKQCASVLCISLGAQLIYQVLIRLLWRKQPEGRRKVLQYNIIVNNSGFLGIPVIKSVYDAQGVLFGSLALIPLRVFMWTSGLALFTPASGKQMIKKVATHPCIIAVVLGFIYMFSGIKLPEFLVITVDSIGNCVTSMSMIVIGSILSDVDLKHIADKDCFVYSLVRLILIPAGLYGLLTLLGFDGAVRGVTVLASAMPSASVGAMLAQKHDTEPEFAVKLLFVSTVLSLVTLPIWSAILK
ncbi:MAG: AEC family transporter [Oscillospiraceae bacterium]|nr:AEC family transporter [Oscillospiraceae bacterium]